MDRSQTPKPAGAPRPARKSLAEFALPPNEAAEELRAAMPPPPTDPPAAMTQRDGQPSPAIAKDYRLLMLEHMKVNMTAALSCMSGLVAAGAAVASASDRGGSGHETDPPPPIAQETAPADGKVAQAYGIKALGLMTANMTTTLEYVQQLTRVKTPSEFVALTASQTRKQLELMAEQSSELGSIARKLTPGDVAVMAGSFARLLGERGE